MIEYDYIPPFGDQEFHFDGAHIFSVGEKSFLLSNVGTSIILEKNLAASIRSGMPNEDLAFKLFQRGFGTAYGHERTNIPQDEKPTLFMIDFTTKCNCNCVYCLRHFEDSGSSISDEMLLRITRFIIDYCKQNSIHRIAFQPWGGEPLIEIDKILKCKALFDCSEIDAKFNIQTNGLLLSLHTYELLNEHGIAIGISLDGIAAVHDKHRVDLFGNTTHERVVRNIKTILEKYPNAQLGTLSVNSAYSVDCIDKDIEYIVGEIGLNNLKFNLVHPSGAEDFDHSILIKEADLDKYATSLLSAVTAQIENGKQCYEANICDRLNNLLDRFGDNICDSRGCRGGISFVSFDQAGNIYPCEMIGHPEFCLGSIDDKDPDLMKMIAKAKAINPFYEERRIEECVMCPFWFFCRGGCKASCLAYGDKPCDKDHIGCILNKALYPRLIELILTKPKVVEALIGYRLELE